MARENITKDMCAIKLFKVDKDFEVATEFIKIIKNVNLEILKGEFVIITGPSGSGKSTLLHILCGWEEPTKGSVMIDDDDIYSVSEIKRTKKLKTKLAFVSQTPSWIKSLNTVENIELPYLLAGNSRRAAHQRAMNLIEMLNLQGLSIHNPADLSGGQQQRTNLLRSLINNPSIVIADEPTGNLDSHSSKFVENLLFQVHKVLGRTVILATHDQSLLALATRVIKIADGQIVETIVNDKTFVPREPTGDITDLEKSHFSTSEEGWLK